MELPGRMPLQASSLNDVPLPLSEKKMIQFGTVYTPATCAILLNPESDFEKNEILRIQNRFSVEQIDCKFCSVPRHTITFEICNSIEIHHSLKVPCVLQKSRPI